MKRTLVRICADDDDPHVKRKSGHKKGDDDAEHDVVDCCGVLAKGGGEEEEGDLEHHWKGLDDEDELPSLEPIKFGLTVSATGNHRPTRMLQVSVQPLLPQHCNKRSRKRDQQARIQESSSDHDCALRWPLGSGENSGFVWDCGLVKGEEDRTEEDR